MIGIQGRKTQNEKQFPGCLGRMVNLFDLGNGMTGNKLLTDRPHNYGSPLSRSCSDVASTLSAHNGDQIGDKMTVSELRRSSSNKRANGTPMKALIAHEMSKEVDSRPSPPNLVAKLMGLETLPHHQHSPATERCHSKAYPNRCLSQSEEQSGYRDVYEIWQQSEGTNVRDNSPQKGRRNERKIDNGSDKKMALVRQKFIEAKRLATDEKSRQSKEFQDALEVLSSNRDLFLKFLQEPHSLFSQHPYDMQSIPSPPETNRITVLRPSKATDNDKFVGSWKTGDKSSRRPNNSEYSPTFSDQRFEEYPAQRTRIVVLKPSPLRTPSEEVVTPPFYEPEDELVRESSEVAEQMNTMGHRRDETVLSSVFSNGYVGDDSSFYKSDNDYAVGNLSDSEIMSPVSRHSWDYINRSSSPFSSSSFSRASCSPESSVCREAKKRLSERWAMMASNGNISEQKETRQSSSTLGEMLALSDINKIVKSKEQEPRGSASSAVRNSIEENGVVDSPKGLLRSRSLPVSSTVYATEPNGKAEISKELKRAKSTKSSLKGKVSSLFFSRNKKSSKEKSGPSQCKDEYQFGKPETAGTPIPSPAKSVDNASQCSNNSDLDDCSSPVLPGPSGKSVPTLIKEGVISVPKAVMSGNISENPDQPSPNSVLEPPFEEDDATVPDLSSKIRPNFREVPLKSNLIDKSPPIESIARTLSWDDSCMETATSYTLKPPSTSSNTNEEQDWPLLIQTLLSESGLDGNTQLDSLPTRWHSTESPLDPILRTKFANLNDKEVLHEAQRRQRRSNRKLMFDCLNATLTQYTSNMTTRPLSGPGPTLYDHVWGQMKEWLFSEAGLSCEGGDGPSLAVEVLVRKEVVGRGWSDGMRVEVDNLGREIEEKLLAELVEDAVVHLTCCV